MKKRTRRGTPWNKKPDCFITCEQCGKIKKIKPTYKNTAKYCSVECKNKSMIGLIPWNKGRPWSEKWKKEQSERTKRAWREGKHDNNPTSSGKPAWNRGKECLFSRGKNNKNYKHGLYPLIMEIRRCDKYREWSRNIFKRDNWTCQICGRRGCNLNAHHIVSFSKIIKDNNINSYHKAMNCDNLWDLKNGRALCVPCHKEVTFRGGDAIHER